jgi:hypothetical protein
MTYAMRPPPPSLTPPPYIVAPHNLIEQLQGLVGGRVNVYSRFMDVPLRQGLLQLCFQPVCVCMCVSVALNLH